MRRPRHFHCLLMILVLSISARAAQGVQVVSWNLNGRTEADPSFAPGERVTGNVTVRVFSDRSFGLHTGALLPSWNRSRDAMSIFLDTIFGLSTEINVSVDFSAPLSGGEFHYLIFGFGEKNHDEMHSELSARAAEDYYVSGGALRLRVAGPPVASSGPSRATRIGAEVLPIGGRVLEGTAGSLDDGEGAVYWARIEPAQLSSGKGDAVRVTLRGVDPKVDLDMEIVDDFGRRRGFAGAEGSAEEVSTIRVFPNERLYARVYTYRKSDSGAFSLRADRVSLKAAIEDPSRGRAGRPAYDTEVSGKAGVDRGGSAWFAVDRRDSAELMVELLGDKPSADLDLWVYDDLGNELGKSREGGSHLERVALTGLLGGTYYIRVGAFRKADVSTFRLRLGKPPSAAPVKLAPVDSAKRTFPIQESVGRDTPLVGFIHVQGEKNFLIEVFTGWGERGKIDRIVLTAPDGVVVWNASAEGRGWEAASVGTRGAGFYRLEIRHGFDSPRTVRIVVDGLTDSGFYSTAPGEVAGGISGVSLDAEERKHLQDTYGLMQRRSGGALGVRESELLGDLETYFREN